MTTGVLPNAESLVSKFCRTDAVILASGLGDRTFTELPANFNTWPACRVTRVGGGPVTGTLLALDGPLIQFDIWGGPKATASEIAEVIRLRLSSVLPFRSDIGCLAAVRRFGGLRYQPDTVFDPARPRYIFDVEFVTKP